MREGLDALTTRRLGERLGVKGPALYLHGKNKQELINALALTFFIGFPTSPGRPTPGSMVGGARKIYPSGDPGMSGWCPDHHHGKARPQRQDRQTTGPVDQGGLRHARSLVGQSSGRPTGYWLASSEQELGGRIPPFSAHLEREPHLNSR